MQKSFIILLFALACFFIENILFQLFGIWFKPNLLLILIVFFNLFRGIRYGVLAALMGGFLLDSFSVRVPGLNTFSFVVCAYLASLLKIFIYQPGSQASRILLVFFVAVINLAIQYVLHVLTTPLDFSVAFARVIIPEILITTVMAAYVFERLKRCALRLFA